MIKSLFRKASSAQAPSVPAGIRVYAIGDIHGCDREFAALLTMIDADHAARAPAHRVLILLGDLVDRGPDSREVVERALSLTASRDDIRLIAGNHEELLLGTIDGDGRAARVFARNGGRETALSYGIDPEIYDNAGFDELSPLLREAVPTDHLELLRAMEDMVVIGEVAFVHAGIRPGVPLAEQRVEDLRWIRDEFLTFRSAHEKYIVHGHTITPDVDEKSNRLGVDTGAFRTGRLTAVALEGTGRWFLQTMDSSRADAA